MNLPGFARSGTAEDLFRIIVRAAEPLQRRAGISLPPKPEGRRRWLEPPLIALGRLGASLLELVPKDIDLKFQNWIFSTLAGAGRRPFDPMNPEIQGACELARRAQREGGTAPALLALTSHAPVVDEPSPLNFELVRHSLLGLRTVRGAPCRPRFMVAVDPFALDTIPLWLEAVYTGLLGRAHIGLDRMAFGRGEAARSLLRHASWERMVVPFLSVLGRGGEAGMVLAGGIPSTVRAYYTMREWLWKARRKSPWRDRPREIMLRLRRVEGFREFLEAEKPLGVPADRSIWRLLEAWGMAWAVDLNGEGLRKETPADSGGVPAAMRGALMRCLEVLEIDKPEEKLEALADEFSRETPFRERLFRILAERVVGRGRPLVFLPVVHRMNQPPAGEKAVDGGEVLVQPSWAWLETRGGRLLTLFPGGEKRWIEAGEFARDFVRKNFH